MTGYTKIKAEILIDIKNNRFKWEVLETVGSVSKEALGDLFNAVEVATIESFSIPPALFALIMNDYKEIYYDAIFSGNLKVLVEIFILKGEIILIDN